MGAGVFFHRRLGGGGRLTRRRRQCRQLQAELGKALGDVGIAEAGADIGDLRVGGVDGRLTGGIARLQLADTHVVELDRGRQVGLGLDHRIDFGRLLGRLFRGLFGRLFDRLFGRGCCGQRRQRQSIVGDALLD